MADISQIRLPSGDTFDLIDEKSGYITAQYIENKTDYSIPVSRVGEIVVGETAIGTDSTNFPTSKAVVDYVDERVVQEIEAIDVGVTGIKAGGTSLSVVDGIVNIPIVSETQSVGLMTAEYMYTIYRRIRDVSSSIPTSISQLTNDSGFITASDIPTVPTKTSDLTNDSGFITSDSDEKLKIIEIETTSQESTYYPIVGIGSNAAVRQYENSFKYSTVDTPNSGSGVGTSILTLGNQIIYTGTSFGDKKNRTGIIRLYSYGDKYVEIQPGNQTAYHTVSFPNKTGTIALTSDIPTVPTNISSFTNDSGYLTASDIASVMTYKGTKANYAALPSTGNTTGDVWHLTDTGAEWAWDGSAWQELGTAIDLSGYVPKVVSSADDVSRITVASTGITLSSSQNDSDYSSSIIVNGEVTISASGRAGTNTLSMNQNTTIIHNLVTPTADKDAANKKYVDDSIGALSIPTKTSDLTNDSGYLTSYTETDPTVPSWAKQSSKPTYTAAEVGALPASTVIPTKTSELTNDSGFLTTDSDEKLKTGLISTNTMYYIILDTGSTTATTKHRSNTLSVQQLQNTITVQIGKPSSSVSTKGELALSSNRNALVTIGTSATANQTITLPDKTGTIALTSDIPDTSSFLTSETDPVFSASAAAGITSTDISNWNGKVSDDKTWNGVTLNKAESAGGTPLYATILTTTSATGASLLKITQTPISGKIAQYDSNAYLKSTTPSANDNSTKVATTAYVDAAIPDTSGFVSKSGDTMSGRLTLNCKGQTDNTGLVLSYNDNYKVYIDCSGGNYSGSDAIARLSFGTIGTSNGVKLRGIATPDIDTAAANKKYVDDSIGALSIPTKTSDLTNDSGFITSYTDEKVKQESLNGATGSRNILTTSSYQTTGTITNSAQYTRYIYIDDSSPYITVVNKTDSSKYTRLVNNGVNISTGTYQVMITAAVQTSIHQITLPNKTGTIALTSDIPQVYSSTNTGGYLTMATLPIYDGTVV